MTSVHYFLVGVMVSMATRSCHGYGWGVPEIVCDIMFPIGHGVDTLETEAPFVIVVNKESYSPNDIIESKTRLRPTKFMCLGEPDYTPFLAKHPRP